MGKEEESHGKEGRELLDFLARDQKRFVPQPGLVRGQRQEPPKTADEERHQLRLGSANRYSTDTGA